MTAVAAIRTQAATGMQFHQAAMREPFGVQHIIHSRQSKGHDRRRLRRRCSRCWPRFACWHASHQDAQQLMRLLKCLWHSSVREASQPPFSPCPIRAEAARSRLAAGGHRARLGDSSARSLPGTQFDSRVPNGNDIVEIPHRSGNFDELKTAGPHRLRGSMQTHGSR